MSSYLNPKLEAIYNAIEDDNIDLAIRLCLKKSDITNLPITLALLSYCYTQQRKLKEAMEVAISVMRHVPTDDHVLNTLSHTYRACKAEDHLALCYENAIIKDPTKDNLMLDLFFIYNRLCDAKKMQLTAQKLYKMKNRPSFVFWSVCSMLLQKDLPIQMLTVAERMIEKVLKDNYKDCQPGAEELELYIHIICKQERYSDALAIFDKLQALSPGMLINDDQEFQLNASKVKMHSLQLMTLRLDLLEKLSLKNESIIELEHIIESYPDQWNAHQKSIDYLFESIDNQIDELVVNHQNKLHLIQSSNSKLRGPFLAEIYLFSKWMSLNKTGIPNSWTLCEGPKDLNVDTISGNNAEALKEYCSLICSYVDKFQSKQCCFADVKQYIAVLEQVKGNTVLQAIDGWTRIRSAPLIKQLDDLVKNNGSSDDERRDKAVLLLCCISKFKQLSFFSNFVRSKAEPVFATSILADQNNEINLYHQSKALCVGGVGGEREVQPGDELLQYCSSAHRILYSSLSLSDNNSKIDIKKVVNLMNWAQLLLYGVEASPYNHVFKLDLLEPYRELAIGEASVVTYSLLRAKHVQNDSMSYLIIPTLVESGCFEEAIRQNKIICSFHRSCKREIYDNISNSFKFCNYMKALELKRFMHRCEKSTQLALSKTELPLLELLEKKTPRLSRLKDALPHLQECLTNSDYPFVDTVKFDEFIDNMDYSIVTRYDIKLDEELIASEKRRHQYLNRIKEAYFTTKMLVDVIGGDPNAKNSLSTLISHIDISSLQEKVNASNDIDDNSYFQWNQNFSEGGIRAKYLVWNVIYELANLCILCNTTKEAILCEEMLLDKSSTPTTTLLAELNSNLIGISETILKAIAELHTLILGENLKSSSSEARNNPRYLILPDQQFLAQALPPLAPTWIRQLTFFTRTLGSWGPLFLQKVELSFPNKKKDKKDKKKKKTVDEEISDSLKGISNAFVKLIDDIQRSLSQEVNEDTKSSEKLMKFIGAWENKFDNGKVISEYRKTIIDQLHSSQVMTCNNIIEILRNSVDSLRT